GVDASVGAAGALRKDTFADGAMYGLGEEALDCVQARLNLPSVKWGSVVGEDELPVSHAVLWTVSRSGAFSVQRCLPHERISVMSDQPYAAERLASVSAVRA